MIRRLVARLRRRRRIRVPCDSGVLELTVIDDAAGLRRGLSGRRALRPGTGLLLVLPPRGEGDGGAIATVGIRFAIDVVFIDDRGRVLEVVERLPPELSPAHDVPCAAEAAVDLRAGEARLAGLVEGCRLPALAHVGGGDR